MVAQNKEKYADALAGFDDLDSPEATKVRQRLFREDWQRQMAQDAMARAGDDGLAVHGGARSSTTGDITKQIEMMQQQNADVFAIPDYFVYMSRAFSTLEGIGLGSDPNYSILKECFPYLAKRLLSDDSPRARGALRMLLYGTGDELNLSKLQDVTSGLESYTVSTSSAESSRGMSDEGRRAAAEQLASVILAEDGNYVQSLLLRESAVALDAAARDALSPPLALLRNLPPPPAVPTPLAPLLAPLTLPLELAQAVSQLQSMDERDVRRLENLRILTQLASGASAGAGRVRGSEAQGVTSAGMGGVEDVLGVARAAVAHQSALVRIGVRFGSSLASVHAEHLRQRAQGSERDVGPGVSTFAKRLAVGGAEGLEGLATAMSSLDSDLASSSTPPSTLGVGRKRR